jgi:pilus assembly protein Flp/PilA
MQDLMIRAHLALEGLGERASAVRNEDGQTAAEYLGIIVLVAAIIAALVGSGVAEDIANFVKEKVAEIAGG